MSAAGDDTAATGAAARVALAADQVSFVLCLEANRLEPQGLLLCESIRTFGGRYARSPIIGVSPRPELALGAEARARFRDLGVTVIDEPLNLTGHPYGTINRIVAGAWAEARLTTSHLIMLDTDVVFTAEPRFAIADVGVRPVDMKGSASSGPDDELDVYWARICALAGIALDHIPMLHATVGQDLIRASYNGGFAVVRRSLEILQKTKDIFFQSFGEDMRPLLGRGVNVKASTGLVGLAASEWWGSSQAALSAAIWSKTRDVYVYEPEYNIPVHLLVDDSRSWPLRSRPVLLHYHYLTEFQHRQDLSKVLRKIGSPPDAVGWIVDRLGIFD